MQDLIRNQRHSNLGLNPSKTTFFLFMALNGIIWNLILENRVHLSEKLVLWGTFVKFMYLIPLKSLWCSFKVWKLRYREWRFDYLETKTYYCFYMEANIFGNVERRCFSGSFPTYFEQLSCKQLWNNFPFI